MSSTEAYEAAHQHRMTIYLGHPSKDENGSPRTLAKLHQLIQDLDAELDAADHAAVRLRDELVFHLLMCHPYVPRVRVWGGRVRDRGWGGER